MKTATKVFAAIIAVATLVFQTPAVQAVVGAFLAAHPGFSAFFFGVASIFALIHDPNKA